MQMPPSPFLRAPVFLPEPMYFRGVGRSEPRPTGSHPRSMRDAVLNGVNKSLPYLIAAAAIILFHIVASS